MQEITSRRHWRLFYLYGFIKVFYFSILGLLIVLLQILTKNGRGFTIIMAAVLLIMVFYTVIRYYKNVPRIIVNKDSISIGLNKIYYWTDLEEIKFAGKQRFKFFLMGENREALTLKFNNSKEIYLFDDMYSNLAQIKQFIKYQIIEKVHIPPPQIIPPVLSEINEQVIYYKSIPFLNYRVIMLWMIITGCIAIGVAGKSVLGIMFLTFICVISFLWFSVCFYYFGVSDNYLIVKNYNRFWMHKVYRLSEIKEVVFEKPESKMPYPLRIITTDLRSDLYQAATLWPKSWKRLKDDLERKNVAIRNESHL
jgi:hypothetical protein